MKLVTKKWVEKANIDKHMCPVCGGLGYRYSERQARCVEGCADTCDHCNGTGKVK